MNYLLTNRARRSSCASWIHLVPALAIATIAATAHAQTWPSRPIQIYHGFAPGGNPDIVARIIAPPLSERLGQAVVVEPKPGAGGRIATNHVAKQPPDGYSLIMLTGGDSVLAATLRDLPYDLIRAFAFITATTQFPFLILVKADAPYRTLRDLIEDGKRRPGQLSYGHSGTATTLHLVGELLKEMAGIDMLHIPTKGTQIQELAAGRLDMSVGVSTSSMPFIKSGKVRVLAVTSSKRTSEFPDSQSVGEDLPGYEVTSWLGLAAPAGTNPAIVERLSLEVRAILGRDDVKTRLGSLGAEPYGTTGSEFRERIESDIKKWRALAAKVRLD
ncbi:MAG: tripartite tricarboxylate transporter substrate binding protein [Burkholderiales bacterium]